MNDEDFKNSAERMGIELSASHLASFRIYCSELQDWNTRLNLTSITDEKDVYLKHFLDSLSIIPALSHLPAGAKKIMDIGTGAGFPGIPLAIVRPELHVTLADSVAKKVLFLEHMIKILELQNASCITGRAEELAHDSRYCGEFDAVTARAVANLATLSEYSLPFLKTGGILIAQKTKNADEAAQAENALRELGGEMIETRISPLHELGDRQILMIRKISATPDKYPRKTGIPLKRPL